MIITSVVLLATAVVLLVVGALQGNPELLGVSLGAAAAGALSLLAGNASARRMAVARGVPVESILAGQLRRPRPAPSEAKGAEAKSGDDKPPIDGYDDMPPRDIVRLVSSGAVPDADLSDMLAYEASHQRRREVLTAIMDEVHPETTRASTEAEARSRRSTRRARQASEVVRAGPQTTRAEEQPT